MRKRNRRYENRNRSRRKRYLKEAMGEEFVTRFEDIAYETELFDTVEERGDIVEASTVHSPNIDFLGWIHFSCLIRVTMDKRGYGISFSVEIPAGNEEWYHMVAIDTVDDIDRAFYEFFRYLKTDFEMLADYFDFYR